MYRSILKPPILMCWQKTRPGVFGRKAPSVQYIGFCEAVMSATLLTTAPAHSAAAR